MYLPSEMRQLFDSGEDPLDAADTAERNRARNPFYSGFRRPFGGGGFGGGGFGGFKFKFNGF